MTLSLEGKVALITGGSKGIGKAIAERLARDGANIAVNYHSDDEAAVHTVSQLKTIGRSAIALKADIARVSEVRRCFAEAEKELGRLDVVVANAAFFIFKPVAEMTEQEYDALFDLNTKGVFFCFQEAARRLREGGRIILISAASTGGAGAPNNSCTGSKAASEYFVKSLAKELASRSITANIVCPGPTRTENFARLPKGVQEQAASFSPFGRIGEPSDIADVVGFLVSNDARWITGQTLRATGGA